MKKPAALISLPYVMLREGIWLAGAGIRAARCLALLSDPSNPREPWSDRDSVTNSHLTD